MVGCLSVSLLFLHSQFQAADQRVATLWFCLIECEFFSFFGFSIWDAWVPKMWALQVKPDAPAPGLQQAGIFGHAVEQASLLQEVRGGAALPDLSFVQDDHPARGGHADMSGRRGWHLMPARAQLGKSRLWIRPLTPVRTAAVAFQLVTPSQALFLVKVQDAAHDTTLAITCSVSFPAQLAFIYCCVYYLSLHPAPS